MKACHLTQKYFNPRSPRGLRPVTVHILMIMVQFQSTQPKRAATAQGLFIATDISISIHAAQEGCDWCSRKRNTVLSYISIHAAQEGCDPASGRRNINSAYFNPRSPRGLRQEDVTKFTAVKNISIHAAQEGCDYGGIRREYVCNLFQSTQPKRAAT